jgi:hypothetical protein
MYMENKLFKFQRFYCADCNIVYSVNDLIKRDVHTCPVCESEPNRKFLNDLSIGKKVTFFANSEMSIPKYDENGYESNNSLTFQKGQSVFGWIKKVFFEKEMGGTCVELSLGGMWYTIIPIIDFRLEKDFLKEKNSNQGFPKTNSQQFVPSVVESQNIKRPINNKMTFEIDPERFKTFLNKYDADGKMDVLLLTLRSLGIKDKNVSQVIGIVNDDLRY